MRLLGHTSRIRRYGTGRFVAVHAGLSDTLQGEDQRARQTCTTSRLPSSVPVFHMDLKGPLLERSRAAGGEGSGTWEVGGVGAMRRQGMGVHPDQNTGGINRRRNRVARTPWGGSRSDRGASRAQQLANCWGGWGGTGKGTGADGQRGFSVGGGACEGSWPEQAV